MKLVLTICGTLCVVLGIVGIFLPLLPTTPFLLLASACFARSSKRAHDWLLSHGVFGEYLRNYEAGRGIPARAKALALVMMWSSLAYAAWRYDPLWLRLLLLAVGTGVSIYLLKLPTFAGQAATASLPADDERGVQLHCSTSVSNSGISATRGNSEQK